MIRGRQWRVGEIRTQIYSTTATITSIVVYLAQSIKSRRKRTGWSCEPLMTMISFR